VLESASEWASGLALGSASALGWGSGLVLESASVLGWGSVLVLESVLASVSGSLLELVLELVLAGVGAGDLKRVPRLKEHLQLTTGRQPRSRRRVCLERLQGSPSGSSNYPPPRASGFLHCLGPEATHPGACQP
jgi:hypothetical protein